LEGRVDNTRQYNDMESTSQQSCHEIVLVGKASPSTSSDAKCDPNNTQERFHLETTSTTMGYRRKWRILEVTTNLPLRSRTKMSLSKII